MHRLHQSQVATGIHVTHEIVLNEIADAFYDGVHLCNNVEGMCEPSSGDQSSTLPISMRKIKECCVPRDRKFYIDQQLTSYLERNLISDAAASKLRQQDLKTIEDVSSLAAAVNDAWLEAKNQDDQRYSLDKFQNELNDAYLTPLEPTPSAPELRKCCAAKHRQQNLRKLVKFSSKRQLIVNELTLKDLAQQKFTSIVDVRPLALKSIAALNFLHDPISFPVDARFGDAFSIERFAYDIKQASRYLYHLTGCYLTVCDSKSEDTPVHSTYAEWKNELKTCLGKDDKKNQKAFDKCFNEASRNAIEARKFNMQDLIGSFVANKVLSPKVGEQIIRDAASNKWNEDKINIAAVEAFADYQQMVASNN